MKKQQKCYIYTRVSTSMQVEGYSLDAQKDKLRKYAEYQEMSIVGEYSDEGKSGKSVEGRPQFKQMLADIESGKDNVDYGTDLLALFKEKSKSGAGYELYSKRWLEYAKNGWKKENDLVLKIGFDSSGLYDIGQERGYGATQNMWMKGISQSIFEASV